MNKKSFSIACAKKFDASKRDESEICERCLTAFALIWHLG
jgi:hypothetical protein